VAVVVHDPTLDRTTDGTGPIVERTLAELRAFDAGFRFTRDGDRTYPWRGKGVRIPTLDEALETFPRTPCIIEIKAAEATEPTLRVIERHGAKDRVLIGSFVDEAHALLQGRGFFVTASKPDVTALCLRSLLFLGPGRVGYEACSLPPQWKQLPLPVTRLARMLHRRGIPTHCWTINDPAAARDLWDGGVNAILSDDPGTMLALLGRGPGAHPAES
jgi:glycerophosphoryl diester phosphodiesterase